MLTRLYFLLPDGKQAGKVIEDLHRAGIPQERMHAHCHDARQLDMLPMATAGQQQDELKRIERIAWNSDLAVFFVALVAFIVSLALWGFNVFSVLLLILMVITYLAGDLFASHISRVHLDEFRDALAHNEVLLMVDVPYKDVATIEDRVHRHHPAAVAGGSSWMLDGLGV